MQRECVLEHDLEVRFSRTVLFSPREQTLYGLVAGPLSSERCVSYDADKA